MFQIYLLDSPVGLAKRVLLNTWGKSKHLVVFVRLEGSVNDMASLRNVSKDGRLPSKWTLLGASCNCVNDGTLLPCYYRSHYGCSMFFIKAPELVL